MESDNKEDFYIESLEEQEVVSGQDEQILRSEVVVEWTASEYVDNAKDFSWYVLLIFAFIAAAVLVYFISGRQKVPTFVTVLLGIIMAISAARKPRTLTYRITSSGLEIEHRFYAFESFRSFYLSEDRSVHYISLQPLKRFMPPLIVHYDKKDGERIMESLSNFLPFEEHRVDVIDRFSKKIRF